MSQAGYLGWYTTAKLSEDRAIHFLKELIAPIGIERAESVYRSDLDDFLAGECLGSELFRLYKHGSVLRVEADEADMGRRIETAIKAIPKSIRGDFLPIRPFIKLGLGAEFIDASRAPNVPVAFSVMVGCWGYSTPHDTALMRQQLFSSPGIHAEKVRIEHVLGALQEVLYLEF